jgi:hypothetical protein
VPCNALRSWLGSDLAGVADGGDAMGGRRFAIWRFAGTLQLWGIWDLLWRRWPMGRWALRSLGVEMVDEA